MAWKSVDQTINALALESQFACSPQGSARSSARTGPTLRVAKALAVRALNLSWTDAFALESLFAARIGVSQEAQEGPKAFIEKRKPE